MKLLKLNRMRWCLSHVLVFATVLLASNVASSGEDSFSRSMNGPFGQGLKDFAGRQGYMTVFGEQVIGSREDDVSVQFQYNNSTNDLTIFTPTGTGGQSNINSMMRVTAGTGVGDQTVESLNSTRYRPGHELMSQFSARFVGLETNVTHQIGMGDVDDRVSFGTQDGVFGVWFREGGNETFVSQTDFSIDTIDGAKGKGNQTGFTIIPENENVFMISYGWLGVTPIFYYVYGGFDLGWVLVHVIDPTNALQEPHLDNPSLPMFAQSTRSSGAGADAFIDTGSWRAGVVSGATEQNSSDRWSSFFVTEATVVSTVGIGTHLASLRSGVSFQGKTNHVKTVIRRLLLASAHNKDLIVAIYPTSVLRANDAVFAARLDAAYVSVDPDNSIVELSKNLATSSDIDITGIPESDIIEVFLIAAGTDRENLNIEGAFLYPGQEISFVTLPPGTGSGTMSIQGSFKEQF